ncbi:MAG: LSU ribosomal protein L2 [Candidatus Wolfebacteria bacterium GW2011_GWE1_48_7]|nr:MAG: LSU ribosomal protein L2 [Candidatus Wolfebacteria bacterium GW2011_GWC2_46_275]KKU66021.1 MAG: LSU ribosomal protein L2 [Candidatus Wolfebacteria bacterium GW2011_GWD2_47_17]KKU71509.1 MAG: LSU ribosomal protein L2 [Candidatus Wolfebacteria bacterium GW2011_GWB1_47_243]KKU76183.1 MAG: LSU ribosomal protein L2 [Candidatus Wolfebacteria bacterium GW2011_GWA1_47_6]KKU90586.1 MAG: LSU ribosomal protein L2 [Candidatus Wolfebacteria bacterium GW2011_GWA2_47_9b]KKU98386.1 MAG: LSU ribosomal 
MTVVDYSVLTKIEPMKSALIRIAHRAGRNNQGRITTRHQGGGVKQLYRMVDFKQNKIDIPARIEAIEYDPYRSAFIARALYNDGERRYILAGKGMKVDDVIITAESAPVKEGNRSKLKNIPTSYMVYNIEFQPGKGGQMVKSAGSYAQVLAHEGKYTSLKLPSGEVRKVLTECYATMGQVSNNEHNLVNIGKAGRSRQMGIRPTVRGTAMNPVDHPYGGGEGVQPRGTKRPKTLWGKVTGGRKTRNTKKRSTDLIIKRRVSKRNK